MSNYCSACSLAFDEERCPACRRKSARIAEPDDICFLAEKDLIWGGMLSDVLEQERIPFMQKNVMGAGMAIRSGPMFESVRFYVPYKYLTAASDVVKSLFSSSDEEN